MLAMASVLRDQWDFRDTEFFLWVTDDWVVVRRGRVGRRPAQRATGPPSPTRSSELAAPGHPRTLVARQRSLWTGDLSTGPVPTRTNQSTTPGWHGKASANAVPPASRDRTQLGSPR